MIPQEIDDAIDRMEKRLIRGVPPQREVPAEDMVPVCRGAVLYRKLAGDLLEQLSLQVAENERLKEESEERARQDVLAMQLGKPRD